MSSCSTRRAPRGGRRASYARSAAARPTVSQPAHTNSLGRCMVSPPIPPICVQHLCITQPLSLGAWWCSAWVHGGVDAALRSRGGTATHRAVCRGSDAGSATMFVRMLKLPEAERARFDVTTSRGGDSRSRPVSRGCQTADARLVGPIIYEYYAGSEGARLRGRWSAGVVRETGHGGQGADRDRSRARRGRKRCGAR